MYSDWEMRGHSSYEITDNIQTVIELNVVCDGTENLAACSQHDFLKGLCSCWEPELIFHFVRVQMNFGINVLKIFFGQCVSERTSNFVQIEEGLG